MNAERINRVETLSGRRISSSRRIPGGDAAEAWQVLFGDGEKGFLKTVTGSSPFQVEALGLRRLQCEDGMGVPEVLAVDDDFLLLSWLELSSPDSGFQKRLGEALAQTHQQCRGEMYGFDSDHFIGLTPQINQPWLQPGKGQWALFWWQYRLEPMFQRLQDANLIRKGLKFSDKLTGLLPDPEGKPSLLHGDLWSGNRAMDVNGRPVFYDPAPYYGNPEAELGMTQMFGGFTDDFLQQYAANMALTDGWRDRLSLYTLYHVLNHVVIFGGGYHQQAMAIMDPYL